MIKFTNDKQTYLHTAVDDSGRKLYAYRVVNNKREIRSILLYDRHIDTFELPPFEQTNVDLQIQNELIPYLGGKLNLHQQRLLDKYLSGSVKILNGCFARLKKARLILPHDYSVVLSGLRNKSWYTGAFQGESDVQIVIPNDLTTYNIKKTYEIKSMPIMESEYTLIAHKNLSKVETFDNSEINKNKKDAINNSYSIKKCQDYIISNHIEQM